MKNIVLLVLILTSQFLAAQLITIDPALASDTAEVKVVFDASLGNQALNNYNGDVYAHTGVITNLSNSSSDWRYVIAEWNQNLDKVKMNSIGDNKYELSITPSIREFYGVSPDEAIESMAFVFRNEDGSLVGKTTTDEDIFVPVYNTTLAVSIISPVENPYFVDINTSLELQVEAKDVDVVHVYLDNEIIYSETEAPESFTHSIYVDYTGIHEIKVEALNDTDSAMDDFVFVVREEVVVEELPLTYRDGINYINETTVALVLHAPYKQSVYVQGSFSQWKPLAMKRTFVDVNNQNLRYWITLNGIEKDKEYMFQYLVDEHLKIADPYTQKVIDPKQDKYIDSIAYPNPTSIPEHLISIASTFKTGQLPYEWQVTNFDRPKVEDLVIYELLIRDFTEAANYQTLIDTIAYFNRLGINAIELMPTNEFEGNDSWGYNPSFYFACDKAYGTANQLKGFIDVCHQNGIAVIIDQVLNHSFSQSPFLQLYFDAQAGEWGQASAENPWYNEASPNSEFSWGFDFNHESEYTKALVDSVNSFWLSEFNVDGIRFDFTKGFTNTPGNGQAFDQDRIDILERMYNEIRQRDENAYVIFEHIADNEEEKYLSDLGILLWGKMTSNYNEATMGYNESNKSDLSWGAYKSRGWSKPHLVTYMESHDEERLMYKNITYGNSNDTYNTQNIATALKRMEMAACFFFTIPGPKMIWQFGEMGYDISIDFNGRTGMKPVKWDYLQDNNRLRLFQVYSSLIELKKSLDIFETADFEMDVAGAIKQIDLYSDGMDMKIVGNFDIEESTFHAEFSQTGTWYDYFTGETFNVENANMEITLKAGEYHMYTTEKLATPDIVTDIYEFESSHSLNLQVYPNPSNGRAELIVSLDKYSNWLDVAIYNPLGERLEKFTLSDLAEGKHIVPLCLAFDAGIYFINVLTENQKETIKIKID